MVPRFRIALLALVALLTTFAVSGSAGTFPAEMAIVTVSPPDGGTIKGSVTWESRVTGDLPERVEFLVDGHVLWRERHAPFVFNGDGETFDTSTLRDGRHILRVRAHAADDSTVASVIRVTVANDVSAGRPTGSVEGRTKGASTTQSSTVYVDIGSRGGTCQDTRTATQAASARTPWCSLERAVAAAPAGASVSVRGGTYPELRIASIHRRPRVTFVPYEAEDVVVAGIRTNDATGFRFEGLRITSYVRLGNYSHDIELVGNDLSPNGIHMRRVNGILIERNRIHDIAPRASDGTCGCAIWGQSWNDDNAVRNVTVRRNVITNLAGDGIHFGNGENILIEGNTITNALKVGDGDHVDTIQIMRATPLVIRGNYFRNNQHGVMFTDHASPGVLIENNVFAEIGSYGINAGDIPHSVIVNNTFWRNGYGAIILRDDSRDDTVLVGVVFKNNIVDAQRSGPTGFGEHDYNLVAAGHVYGRHDRRGKARFVDPESGDFRLAARSKGIDAASSTGAPMRDRFGKSRRDIPGVRNLGSGLWRYYDVGAHER